MPLVSADPFGGVIITDWYSPPQTPNERFKVNIYILGRALRADGIRASVFRQTNDTGAWADAPVALNTSTDLENAILTRARQLRMSGRPAIEQRRRSAPAEQIMASRYNFLETEQKWQSVWAERGSFKTAHDPRLPKYYVLEMFPYPSGRIHMGHVRNYTMGDVVARYKRARGFNVLHPMGWDAFGLPAENAARDQKIHPARWTYDNIATMRAELKRMGLSLDWSRELATCHPGYYKYQQELFLDFFKAGLAYRGEAFVNWDPVDHTVLANEQVIDGKGWRSGAPVEKKKLSQWFLKITAYADELLEALKGLDRWPEKVRLMQENWIGKSTGAYVRFKLANGQPGRDDRLTIFTTRRTRCSAPRSWRSRRIIRWRKKRRRKTRRRSRSSPSAAPPAPRKRRSRRRRSAATTPASRRRIRSSRISACRSTSPTSC